MDEELILDDEEIVVAGYDLRASQQQIQCARKLDEE